MLSVEDALASQTRMAGLVVRIDDLGPVRRITGVDVAYAMDDARVVCAAATLDAEMLEVIEIATASGRAAFPYVPGLFSFRELPIALEALGRLAQAPDLVVCDGQGLAHPRRFGLACHLGVVAGLPTIGCAKTRLVGRHDEPGPERGAAAPLVDGGEVVGAVLRTQAAVRPVYVSAGHRVSLETACAWVLRLSPRYRLPETTRVADHAVRAAMRGLEG